MKAHATQNEEPLSHAAVFMTKTESAFTVHKIGVALFYDACVTIVAKLIEAHFLFP